MISTKWFGPASPFGSGGLTRNPKTLKLSWLLIPSKLAIVPPMDWVSAAALAERAATADCSAPSREWPLSAVPTAGPARSKFTRSVRTVPYLAVLANSRSDGETSNAAALVNVGFSPSDPLAEAAWVVAAGIARAATSAASANSRNERVPLFEVCCIRSLPIAADGLAVKLRPEEVPGNGSATTGSQLAKGAPLLCLRSLAVATRRYVAALPVNEEPDGFGESVVRHIRFTERDQRP